MLTLLGCSLRLQAGDAAGLELTGVVDLGSLRLACLKIQPGGQGLVLREGQTRAGVKLVDLDARNGWVWLEQGTNLVQLRLRYSASARTELAAAQAAARSQLEQHRAEMRDAEQHLNAALATGKPVAVAVAENYPGSSDFAAITSGTSAPTLAPSPATVPTPGASQPDEALGQKTVPVKSVADPEGDRIRGMLGTEAYLVWDLAHADRWQKDAAQ